MNVGWFVVWFVFFKYWVLIWIEFLCEYQSGDGVFVKRGCMISVNLLVF